MGTIYFIGIMLILLFIGLGWLCYYNKHKTEIQDFLLGWLCYQHAKDRGYIRPGEYEADRIALEFALKHNKKTTWTTFN
jgi:hypothetical protein